jgi:hypothetical protein
MNLISIISLGKDKRFSEWMRSESLIKKKIQIKNNIVLDFDIKF